jgi:hypothetical protein
MRVIAIPNAAHPPSEESLGVAAVVLRSLDDLTPDLVGGLDART